MKKGLALTILNTLLYCIKRVVGANSTYNHFQGGLVECHDQVHGSIQVSSLSGEFWAIVPSGGGGGG